MEPFLEAFGGLTLGTIAVLIAAIIFSLRAMGAL